MRFKANRDDFYKSIQNIIGVVPVKTTVPILSNILVELEGSTLTLTGTDLEVSISTKVEVQGEENGAAAIPAKILHEILRELPDIPLELSCDEDLKITLNTEKGFYRLSGEPKEDFPRISIDKSGVSFGIDSERFSSMINRALFAVSTDELRTTLMGVYLKITDKNLRLVTTDGHRLVRIDYKDFESPEFQSETIIPTKALNLLLKNQQNTKEIVVRVSDDHIVFELGNTVIYSKCIEGQFPNYERVIPTDNDKKVVVDRELISQSVRRVSIFSNSITHQIRLSISNNQLSVKSEDIEFGGEARESIAVEYSGDSLEIGYNANYLLDILRHLETEEIVFDIKDSISAGTISPTSQREDEEILMLLMPIRLNDE